MRYVLRFAPLTFVLLVAACANTTHSAGEAPAARVAAALPACDPDNGGLSLPQGFCALVAHEGVGPARHIAVAPNGDVFVALRNMQNAPGAVVGLRDTNGDGRLDRTTRFGDVGGTGIAVHDGYLYFAPDTYVMRWRLPDGDALAPTGAADTIVSGFDEQRSHAAKTLAFDGRGGMYVNVGGPSNACQVQDRQAGSPGRDPCPELERAGGVWRFDAARAGQRQNDGVRYATGIRNAVALAWNRNAGDLYVVQHGRDMLNVIAPDEFTPQDNAETPSEELLRVTQGSNFGWPYCYHDPQLGRRVLAPEYGGDGREVGRCAQYPQPLAAYPAHWAPNDMLFYEGQQFPERFRGGLFIAWHGSWNRAPLPQRGYKVTFRPMRDGRPDGEFEVFADGFAGRDTIPSPQAAEFRPMGLAVAADGTLYVVDSRRGRIWRIIHRPSR
jgi:glucose/arabinose dehydrogenase